MSSNSTYHFFAPCPRGLDALLAAELQHLGASSVSTVPGGAAFSGGMDICWRVNLESRLASRVLMQLSRTAYRNEKDVYDAAYAIDWPSLFAVQRSLRVDVNAI